MSHLLDTNLVIEVLRGNPAVISRLRQHEPRDVAVSSIVMHELYYGAYRGSRVAENLSRVDMLQFEILEFDAQDAKCAGEVRASLAAVGKGIGAYDVLIAGQALSRSLTLVTANIREFQRVKDLKLENWQG